MLNDQKCYSENFGLSFDKFATSYSHDAFTSRTVFVKPEISEPYVACLDKGKNVIVHEHVKVESKIPVKKQSKSKFILTCFRCGIIGHTRPYCLQICSQNLGLRSMILRKVKLVENLSCPNMLTGKRHNLLKSLFLLAIIVAKLVKSNLAAST
jgi:hypothetical protein